MTTPATALADALLTSWMTEDVDSGSPPLIITRDLTPSALVDEDYVPTCEVLLLRGRELTAEILSACDLAGIRVVGLTDSVEDEATLDRLKLWERQSLPLNHQVFREMLGGCAPDEWTATAHVPMPDPDAGSAARPEPKRKVTRDAPPRRPVMSDSAAAPVTPGGMGSVIAVWGAKGSPGVTVTAAGLAAASALAGHRTILVDADVHGGSVAAQFGLLDESPGLVALCRQSARGILDDEALAQHTARLGSDAQGFDVVTGIADAGRWPDLDPGRVAEVLDFLRTRYERVIIDTAFSLESDEDISSDFHAPRRNGVTLTCLKRATAVIAVTTPDPVSLTRHIISLSRLREVTESAPLLTCINRVQRHGMGIGSGSAAGQTLRRFADIERTVEIPNEPDSFTRSLAAARPVAFALPKSRVTQALHVLEREVTAAVA